MKPSIIYFGNPEFAVEGLRVLHESGYKILGVVTGEDNHGRPSDVKKYAISQGLRIFQPHSLKDPEFIDSLRGLGADLFIVVAFRMLPEVIWGMPKYGTINAHASLLPKFRGAAPIQWTLISGEEESGVTIFRLKHEIDTGNILAQKKIKILPEDNLETLYSKLMKISGNLLLDVVARVDSVQEIPQHDEEATPAPKIYHSDCEIPWEKTATEVHNFIRGMYPGWTKLEDGRELKIYKTRPNLGIKNLSPGQLDTDHKTYLRFGTRDGSIDVLECQLPGKKRMSITDFLRGWR